MSEEPADHVLVKRGLYYRPNNAGYTGRRDQAGLYPKSDAWECGTVTAIPFDEAPLFAPKCWHEVQIEYYEEKVKALRDALRDPPKHEFWRAGEPDCPPDLKAGNGELHTLQCKHCGEGARSKVCQAKVDALLEG